MLGRIATAASLVATAILMVGCPDTKDSNKVDQTHAFPAFDVRYTADAKVTTATAQVWQNDSRQTSLRLTGNANLTFQGQSMDLHDDRAPGECCQYLNGTYYRRSFYDLAPQSNYNFVWTRDDGSTLSGAVAGISAPVIAAPLSLAKLSRKDGLKVTIADGGYAPTEETLNIRVRDDFNGSVDSGANQDFQQIAPGTFFLPADRMYRLTNGKIYVVARREVKATVLNGDGSTSYATISSYEAPTLSAFLTE